MTAARNGKKTKSKSPSNIQATGLSGFVPKNGSFLQLKMRNVYRLETALLPPSEEEELITEFNTPERLDVGLYGWNVCIKSKNRSLGSGELLYVETFSQFQFTSSFDLIRNFKNKIFLDAFAELVYAANCHHAALLITAALEYDEFEHVLPEWISNCTAKKLTERIMKQGHEKRASTPQHSGISIPSDYSPNKVNTVSSIPTKRPSTRASTG